MTPPRRAPERSPKGNFISDAWARDTLEKLQQDSEAIVDYTNNHIAHASADPPQAILTWEDLNNTIDLLSKTLSQVGNVLRAEGYYWDPAIAADWRGPFRQPLL